MDLLIDLLLGVESFWSLARRSSQSHGVEGRLPGFSGREGRSQMCRAEGRLKEHLSRVLLICPHWQTLGRQASQD